MNVRQVDFSGIVKEQGDEVAQGLDDYVTGRFTTHGERSDIWVLISWYAHQTVEHAAHAPTSFLLGGGWDLLSKRVLPPPLKTGGRSRSPRWCWARGGGERLVSNFWLLQRGRVVTSEWLNKWYLLQDALLRQRTDGALVRVEMAVPPGKTVNQVQETLNDFTASL